MSAPSGAAPDLLSAVGELVGTLSSDYDLTELLQVLVERTVELFDVEAAGLILAGASAQLQVMAATEESARVLELFQIQNDEGPCLDCTQTGEAVLVDALDKEDRWPVWGPAAVSLGFRSVAAIPMTARGETFGALNLFGRSPCALAGEQLTAAKILAQVASVVVVHERTRNRDETLIEQLQTALNSRVVIEQAKGVIAERGGVPMEEAFALLRSHARSHRLRIALVAQDVVEGRRDVRP